MLPQGHSKSVCSAGKKQSAPAQHLPGMPPPLPRAMTQQEETKPLQVFCPLFLTPLDCTEKALARSRQLFPPAIAVEEKGVLDWACSMTLSLAPRNTG